MTAHENNALPRFASLSMSIAPVAAASLIGSLVTLPNIPAWYTFLAKPWFTPPNWVFGPVWTTLYVIMAYAFYRVLRQHTAGGHKWIITVFTLQIALNAGWSLAFFGGRSPMLGLIVIVPLCLSVAWTLVLFWKQDRLAGALLAPYLLWVLFASALNFEVWRLNA
jgi:benzodiazapine receptor